MVLHLIYSNSKHSLITSIFFSVVEVVDESGDKVVSGQWLIFVVGAGGFGGKRTSDQIVPPVDPPKRQPDASLSYKTSIDQVSCMIGLFVPS